MKLFQFLAGGALLIDSTDALRRGHKRRNSFRKATLDLDRFELPQGDDPFARMINDQPAFDRGARPDYGPQAYSGSAEVCAEDTPKPLCPPAPECVAEMKKEDECKCNCEEEPPPKCDLDVVLLIDVCSCSIDVWNGIKSYADAIVTKYHQEIGISAEEVRVSLIQFSQATKTVLSFADDYDTIINAIENDMTMDDFVAQGMYVTNGIDNVIDDFRNSRPGSKKVLITVSDGYTHPSIQASDVQNKLSQLGEDVQLHAISRSAYRRRDQCNFPSQARTNVCQRRADVLEMLNNGDNQIYMYSDAQSTHDVIESGKEACPPPPKKALHCECECDLPDGCPGERGVPGEDGRKGEAGGVGEVGADGKPGDQGKDGEPGEKGPKGPDGSPGYPGPKGEPGVNGQPGNHGQRGSQGPNGDIGIKGPQGPSGDTGDNGNRGQQGPPGKMGEDGMPGAPGKVGQAKVIDMASLKDAVYAILDELKPGGEDSDAKLRNMNLFH